jgi:hypothetical protein
MLSPYPNTPWPCGAVLILSAINMCRREYGWSAAQVLVDLTYLQSRLIFRRREELPCRWDLGICLHSDSVVRRRMPNRDSEPIMTSSVYSYSYVPEVIDHDH